VTRMNRRLLLGAIALLIPALAGCEAGLNAPTLEFHPASNGVSVVHDGITIDNAFVLATGQTGSRAGLFVALQSENGDRLESVKAPGVAGAVKLSGGTVDLPAQRLVDLSGPSPQIVLSSLTNTLSGGQTIQLTFTFAEAGAITLGVPVEPRNYDYSTYSAPATPTPTPTPKKTVKPKATAPVSPGASGTASASVTESASPSS
jgi:copper(I)-binding protein